MRTHYGPWQPCWISNQHQKHKSGRGSSSEHFWQVWLKSVQRIQRRRFKCEKLMDERRTLTHDKSSHGLWPGELKTHKPRYCEKEKDKANKRILRSLSFDNNDLVKPSCGTVALYGHFGFFLRYGGLSMNNLG